MARVVLDWALEKSMRTKLSRMAFLNMSEIRMNSFTIDSYNYWSVCQNEVCELRHTHTYSVHIALDSHTFWPTVSQRVCSILLEALLWTKRTECAKYLEFDRLRQYAASHSISYIRQNQTSAHTINRCWSASKNSKSFDETILNSNINRYIDLDSKGRFRSLSNHPGCPPNRQPDKSLPKTVLRSTYQHNEFHTPALSSFASLP